MDELRQDAVQITLTSGLTRKQVADDLGVGISTLNKWITTHRGKDVLSKEDLELAKENDRLRRENRILKEEREILKKGQGVLREPKAMMALPGRCLHSKHRKGLGSSKSTNLRFPSGVCVK